MLDQTIEFCQQLNIFHMEQQFPIFLTFLLFIFALFRTLKNRKNSALTLPPGPWKLPLIGSMHHLIGTQPHHCLRDLAKKYGPLMHLQLGEVTNVVISSPEMAMQVMKTHDVNFAQRPFLFAASVGSYNYTDIIFAPYGDYWRQMRKLCTMELLTTKRVQSFRLIRGEEVSKLITSISSSAGSPINFSLMFNSLVYSVVSRTAFGKIWKGEEILIPALKKMTQAAGGFALPDLYPSIKLLHLASGMRTRLEKLHRVVDSVYEDIINEHRSRMSGNNGKEEEDLVDVLLNLQDQGDVGYQLTTDNLKAIVQDVFAGGIDTTTTTAEWAMSEMVKNPRVMEKAQEEVRRVFSVKGKIEEEGLQQLSYLKMVIKESLRLHTPLPFIPRECRHKCVINGHDIPAKSKVMVNVWAIARDPNYWIEPEKFFPERFLDCRVDYKGTNFELLPFGGGRRICPGMSFGMANVELPLAQLLYHFDWKLPTGTTPQNLDMDEVFGVVLKRKNDLHLIPTPYIPPVLN